MSSLQFAERGSLFRVFLAPLPKYIECLLALLSLVVVDRLRVHSTEDAAFPEFHLVTGQCTGLVGEDVSDLTQLLDQGGCTT